MSSNENIPPVPSGETDAWVDAMLAGIIAEVETRQGRVVVYDDDHSPAQLVSALLSLVLDSEEDPMKADYLMHKIHSIQV